MSIPCAHCTSPSRRTPSPRQGAHLFVVVALAFLMVAGGFLVLAPAAGAGPVAAASGIASSTGPRPVLSGGPGGLQSGAALQNGPYLTNPGTPFSSLTNVSGTTTLDASTAVHFTVGFQIQNASELAQVINEQQTPGSPLFHHWLTLAQERQMFGANPVVVQNTINYFTSLGFTVGTVGPISVSFSGTAAQVDQAFRTQMQTVNFQNGSSSAMNVAPLSLPSAIAGGISTINGLDEASHFQPTHSVDTQLEQALSGAGVTPALTANSLLAQTYANLTTAYNNSNHAYFWFHYISSITHANVYYQVVTPGALTYLYNGTQLINQGYNGNSTGRPINIAIVMAGGINPDDLSGYGQLVWNNPKNILDRLTPTPVDGSFTTNGTVTWTDGASGEMALDIEYSSTMAPGAHITPVYGPCLCTNVLDDDYAVLDSMTTVPNIISNSWGGEEDGNGNLYGPNYQNDQTMHYYFMLLDARGATILASSADGGGFDKGTGILSGSFPATDPYVLSVDGLRTVAADSSGTIFPLNPTYGTANVSYGGRLTNWPTHVAEAVHMPTQSFWYAPTSNTTLQTLPPYASGGFGTSGWFNQSWWQHAPGVPDIGRSLGSGVAAEADFNESIYFDGGFEFFYGGTSFACPTTAGEFALVEDYMLAHGTLSSPGYLGNGNVPVWTVANAWLNHNLSLVPFYDVTNGTSFWGNRGVAHGFSWPPGQKFPLNATTGAPTYGNTLPGYDFPTGWGSLEVANFAADLNYLYSLPGTFMTVNAAGTAWNVGGWGNMVLNHTYSVDVNVTSGIAASNPRVTLVYQMENGPIISIQPTLTLVGAPSIGERFTLDTGTAPFLGPGLLIFELSNSTSRMLGFGYTWISAPLPTGGVLNVTVVSPGTSSMVGGYGWYSYVPGYSLFFPPVSMSPGFGPNYPNSLLVRVTLNGTPVYNAVVTASIASPYSLPWQDSRFQNRSDSQGQPHEMTFGTVSQTFTNVTGYALVTTWNVNEPTTFDISANYSTAHASTTYQITPGPNIHTTDNYGGKYSQFATVGFLTQYYYRQQPNPTLENLYVPNSVNMTNYYNMIYGWAGEELPVSAADYQGSAMSGVKVWLATLDLGGENRFYHYSPSFGLFGVTNTSGTSNYTGPTGSTMLQIPDNMSGFPFYTTPQGNLTLGAFIAASVPGESNRTFSYTEPCAPTKPNINTQITCYFNNSYQRNYSGIPLLVLPNPIDAWTETPALVHRDFFNVGQNISWAVNVNLPTNDPFVTCFGCNWPAGLEHVVTVRAYVDGVLQGDMSPAIPPDYQTMHAFENFSGQFRAGIHILKVVVTDSLGHVFSSSHTFIVGSVTMQNLGISNTYTVVPYTVNWTLNLPSQQVNNHTFNQSFNIRYIAPGCGGPIPCPAVVNLTERVKDGVIDYNQSINSTLLNINHFYAGEDQLPPGQYQVIVWLSINGTHGHVNASISAAATTYFVFTPLQGFINGPTANQVVPLGNVTISYSYQGDYVTNASLLVFAASNLNNPVFSVGAFLPGIGLRGSSASWPAVQTGTYLIVLALGTSYGHYNATQWINVSLTSGTVYLNKTQANGPIGSMDPAGIATALAVIAAILGLIVGMFVAPTLRGGRGGAGGGKSPTPPKAWEEGSTPGGVQAANRPESAKPTCSVCHDTFESDFAMHQHQKIVHGIEE